EQILGQTLGLPPTMIVFSAMGVIVTSAAHEILPGADVAQLWDPQFILAHLVSDTAPAGLDAPLLASAGLRMLVAVIAPFGIVIPTVAVNIAANVVSPANDFANLAPRPISLRARGLLPGLLRVASEARERLSQPS